jgi:hypothetical protein
VWPGACVRARVPIHTAECVLAMIVRTTPSPLSTVVAAPRPSVAALCLTTANFHPGNDGSGHLEITDPPVVEQKSGNAPATIAADTVLEVKVPDSGELTFAGPTGTLWLDMAWTFTGKVADFGTQESIDLPGIGFGAHLTLGYSKNSNETSGILAVKDGTQIANGNYMATSFVTAADGHGGTLITEAAQAANQVSAIDYAAPVGARGRPSRLMPPCAASRRRPGRSRKPTLFIVRDATGKKRLCLPQRGNPLDRRFDPTSRDRNSSPAWYVIAVLARERQRLEIEYAPRRHSAT